MDYRELFTQVERFLSERGYVWVGEQVKEELATGKLTEERLSTLTEVKTAQVRLVESGDFRKGQQAEFVRRAEYTDQEALVLLLEAARRAICEATVMTEDLRKHLLSDDLAAVRFESERDGDSQSFALLANAPSDSSSAADCMLNLDALIRRVWGE